MSGNQDNVNGNSQWVRSIDLVEFLANFQKAKMVLLKLDIEGSEFPVLTRVVASNVLCGPQKAFLSVEWHPFDTQVHPHFYKFRREFKTGIEGILKSHCNVTIFNFN